MTRVDPSDSLVCDVEARIALLLLSSVPAVSKRRRTRLRVQADPTGSLTIMHVRP